MKDRRIIARVTPRLRLAAAVVPIALAALSMRAPTLAQAPGSDSVDVQLLAFNDFHGNLEPPSGANGRIETTDAGGAEYLATHLKQLKAQNPNSLIVAAGDAVGASPLLSGMFHDEPAVEALNAMGLDISSVGNHEFDNGWRELYRLQNGGCHPVDGCQDSTPFAGAKYSYLAANVLLDPRKVDPRDLAGTSWTAAEGRPRNVLPAYLIKEVGGVRVGFVGMALKATPELVMPAGVRGLTFQSEADSANRWVRLLKREGVRAIVVLIHQGGVPSGAEYNGCPGVVGPILEIANRLSDDVDVVVSGHTHQAYNCTMDKKLVTSAASFGRLITAINLRIDKSSDEVLSKTARNVIVTRDVPKDPDQTAIIDHYRPFYSAVASKVVGAIAGDITRAANPAGESALGNVVADATLEVARAAQPGPVDFAFMNPGGLRADLVLGSEAANGQRSVTFGDASTVLPFRNRTVIKTMSGEMIRIVLEQQFDNPEPGLSKVLSVSEGFTYSYDGTAPRSKRVIPGSMKIGGRPVSPKQHYRVAVNEFVATGGDGFTNFTTGDEPVIVGMDLDALIAYLTKYSPVTAAPLSRITRVK